MRFSFFTKGDKTVPSSRFRAFFLADTLREMGHEVSIVVIPPSSAGGLMTVAGWREVRRYVRVLWNIDRKQPIYLQRTIYNKYFLIAVLVARVFRNLHYVFDIDDAVYVHSPWKTSLLVRLASAVTCGGEEVSAWVRKRTKWHYIFYNALPAPYFENVSFHRKRMVIGWIGNGPAHRENLSIIAPSLARLAAEFEFTFKLIGAVGDAGVYRLFADIPSSHLEIVDELDWMDPYKSARALDEFVLGLMPLKASEWDRAKYMKTLEYMSRGVIPVVSPVGENARIVTDRGDGYLVQEDEWYDMLKEIMLDVSSHERVARAAFRTAQDKFSMRKRAEEFIRIVRAVPSYV